MSARKRNSKRSKNRESTRGKSPDPYLRSFLRQAVAIIASERGLNDTSQSKLQAIANQLGLAEPTYLAAIEKLKTRNPSISMNRYEKEFVQFIGNELQKMSGDILTIKAENRVIDLADKRYKIDSVRAHQLLQSEAEKHNVGIISHHEAELFATNLIDEAVAKRAWLRENDMKRLQSACRKWGLTEDDVNNAIQARIERNKKNRQRSLLSISSALLGLILLTGAVVHASQQIRWTTLIPTATTSQHKPDTSELANSETNPEWWNKDLVASLQRASDSGTHLKSRFDALALANPDQRRDIYRQLVGTVLNNKEPDSNLNLALSQLYYCDPSACLLYTSPSPRDRQKSRMPSSA